MLSISLTTQAEYFTSTASLEYYSNSGQGSGGVGLSQASQLGTWFGQGATALGLPEALQQEAFLRVFQGFDPHDPEKKLVQNAGDWQRVSGEGEQRQVQRRRSAWDLTFSAPKSVSVLMALGTEEVRAKVLKAHTEAVTEVLEFLENRLAFGRRGKDGQRQEPVGLVVGRFTHVTSREGDPQLHSHSVVMNIGVCSTDSKVVALEALGFYSYKMLLGAVYRASLAAHLKQDLPALTLESTPLGRGQGFEISGLPESVLKGFSKRSEQLQSELKDRGLEVDQASAALKEQLTVISRRRKEQEGRLDDLIPQWQAEAQGLGLELDPGGLSLESLSTVPRPTPTKEQVSERDAVLQTVQVLSSRWSFFKSTAVLTGVLERSAAEGRGVQRALTAVEDWLAGVEPKGQSWDQSQAVLLKSPQVRGKRGHLPIRDPLVTTVAILEQEQRMLAGAKQLADTPVQPLAGTAPVPYPDPEDETGLTPEQASVLHKLLKSSSHLRLLQGVPGAGKTAVLGRASHLWQQEGRPVLALALQGRTAEELGQRTRAPAQTLHSLLSTTQAGTTSLEPGTILMVDEASMIETPILAPLVSLAQQSKAILILTGDPHQLPAIGPGGGFSQLLESFPDHTLTLGTPLRQQIPWQQAATLALANQDMAQGFQAYAERGHVHISTTNQAAQSRLISAWSHGGGAEKPQDHLIVAMTNPDVDYLNQLAQSQRLAQGQLDPGDRVPLGPGYVYRGDRVVIRRDPNTPDTDRIPYQRYGVKNGTLAQVERIQVQGRVLHLKLDNGKRAAIPLDHFPHVRLAYAGTTHLLQGRSAEKVFVLMGGMMQDREQTLVQLTRHKQQVDLFVAEDWLGDQGLEHLIQVMNRSRAKALAMTQLEQAQQRPAPQRQQQLML